MFTPNIIVVGASAGGITALTDFVRNLPADYQGSVFIVLHIPPDSETLLAEILTKAGPLKAYQPYDGEKIKPGRIYVATNDHHLLIDKKNILIKKGPKENRFRPSIDALFRSAAYSFGSRVIGIILSGLLNDGTSGLWTIKQQGGTSIVQQPADALFPEMPENVSEYVEVDYTIPAAAMGPLLGKLISRPVDEIHKLSEKELSRLKMEVVIAIHDNAFDMGIMDMGELTPFTCPECHGALIKLVEGNLLRYRCHTGHAYTASTLLASVTESVESLLWQGMRAMEETTMLLRNIALHFEELQDKKTADLFHGKAKATKAQAQVIHDSIFKIEQYSEDIRYDSRLESKVK